MTQWWIDNGKVLGSGNPTTGELRILYGAGFRTIVSLIEEGEEQPMYDVELIKAIGYRVYSIPVRNFGAPTMIQFDAFLRIVNNNLESEKILVHCMGGLGRTGIMGAAYWISKGLSADEAIGKIRESNPKAIGPPGQESCLRELETCLRFSNKKSIR